MSEATAAPGRASQLAAIAILAGAAVLLLANLGNQSLWQDEAQTAVIAGTILTHGIPLGYDGRNHFSQELGKEYAEGYVWRWQTWLSFYVTAASFLLFGESSFTARLPFALFGLATVGLAYAAGLALWRSRAAALCSAGMLAVSVPFLILSRQCRYYAMVTFFSLLGLTAYARLGSGRRRPALVLFAAAFLVFHTHYVYCATLLATLALHALLFERARLRPVLLVGLAVALIDLPWIVWFSGVRPGGEGYLASVLDLHKALHFATRYVELLAEHFFDGRLLAIPAVLIGFRAWRRQRPQAPDAETRGGLALLLLYCAVSVVLLSVLSPLLFYRYLAPLGPPLMLLAGLLVGTLFERSRLAGAAVLGLWIAASPLDAFLGEISHDFDGPIEGIVDFLERNARPDDVVAISYGDLPLKFYTDLRVIGGLTGEDLSGLPDADWIILRRHTNTKADGEIQKRMREILQADPQEWVGYTLAVPDTPFENREDPRRHRFRTAHPSLPRVVVYGRRERRR